MAENLAKGLGYYTREKLIDNWMESEGHRLNLLYPHGGATFGCYDDICVFLGFAGFSDI